MSESLSIAYVGLGANLGEPARAIEQALQTLRDDKDIQTLEASSLWRTAPVDARGPHYLNAVARVTTHLSAQALMDRLHQMETRAGRERPHRNAPRVLDLDLILYDSAVIRTDTLTVPHPRMHLRAFVLVPLAELAPDIEIPGHGPIKPLLDAVSDQDIELFADEASDKRANS